MRDSRLAAGCAAAALLLSGCGTETPRLTASVSTGSPSSVAAPPEPTPVATLVPEPSPARSIQEQPEIIGTLVRFTAGETVVDVTIATDNPTTRDFLSTLPLTLSFEEFNGREKIAYLPRELDTTGSPGSDPEDGDLIYYSPWGNLGFYYDTAGIGYSDQVITIGTTNATLDQLEALEQGDVTVTAVPE